jgi:hypothetical protein
MMVCAPEFDKILLNRVPELDESLVGRLDTGSTGLGTGQTGGEKSTETSKPAHSVHGCLNSSAHLGIIQVLSWNHWAMLMNGSAPMCVFLLILL